MSRTGNRLGILLNGKEFLQIAKLFNNGSRSSRKKEWKSGRKDGRNGWKKDGDG